MTNIYFNGLCVCKGLVNILLIILLTHPKSDWLRLLMKKLILTHRKSKKQASVE